MFRALLLHCLILAALCGCETTRPRTFPPGAAIPFELKDGFIRVEVDSGRKVLHFLVDTGAGHTVLNQRTANRLRLRYGESVPVYGVRTLGSAYRVSGFKGHLAGHPLRSDLYSLPLGHSKGSFDGMIGYDFFDGRIVEIDYAARLIHIRRNPPPPGPDTLVLPMRRMHDIACVPVSVNGGRPEWTRLDTGCVTPLEWGGPFASEAPRPAVRREVVGNVGLGRERLEGILIGLHPKPIFHDEAGLLGNGLLSRYRVTLDGRAMKLYLQRR